MGTEFNASNRHKKGKTVKIEVKVHADKLSKLFIISVVARIHKIFTVDYASRIINNDDQFIFFQGDYSDLKTWKSREF